MYHMVPQNSNISKISKKKTLKLKIKLWLYACVLESNSKNPVLWSNRSEGDLVKCVLRARDIT